MPTTLHARLLALPLLLVSLLVLPACDGGGGGEQNTDTLRAGLNLTRLFAPATSQEIAQIRSDWASRNPTTEGTKTTASGTVDGAFIGILQHTVTTGNGTSVTHYGVVRIPEGASNLPVLVVHHGGDNGFSIDATTANTGVRQWVAAFPTLAANTVQIWPVYRSESIKTGSFIPGGPFQATGEESPWDYDVDDSIAFLTAALERWDAETDADRVAALGMSRGANTALFHAIRDGRIDAVTDYYGPTDFYNADAQGLAVLLVLQTPSALNLPGGTYLLSVLGPLRNADGTYNANADYDGARLEVARRSTSLFTQDLPDTQVHHHFGDPIVTIPFSQALDAAVAANGSGGTFEFNSYGAEGVAQDPSYHAPEVTPDMQASLPRTESFLLNALNVSVETRRPAFSLAY